MNLEEQFVQLIRAYFPWVPDAYWPLVTLSLASVFIVAAVVERLTAIGNVLAMPFRHFFKKKPIATVVDPPPVRVLRAVWLRDRPPRPTLPKLDFVRSRGEAEGLRHT